MRLYTVRVMALNAAVKQAEEEIDATFASSSLVSAGFSQAVWTLLSFNEDHYLKHLHELPDEQLHVYIDIRLNALTYPLRACFSRCEVCGEPVRHELLNSDYQAASDWLKSAEDYGDFCTIFPMWHRHRVDIELGRTCGCRGRDTTASISG
jgi:hypothetical protein